MERHPASTATCTEATALRLRLRTISPANVFVCTLSPVMSVWASASALADLTSPDRAARTMGRRVGEAVAPPETIQSSKSSTSSGAGRAHAARRSRRLKPRSMAGAVDPCTIPSHASLIRASSGPPLESVVPQWPSSDRRVSACTYLRPVQSRESV
eukprot:scaffold85704_cov37-Tisochrysis_lutea.AAC.1